MAYGNKSGGMSSTPSGKSGSGGNDYGYEKGNTGRIAKAMPEKSPQTWLDKHELQHSDYGEVTGGGSTISE